MGDLANKQISQTYDGLIQTGTDNPIDGTLRPLQDGSGNNLPVEVSSTGVNFTGTVTGIDTGVQSVVAGTNVTVDATDPANPIVSASGGGGGGIVGVDFVPSNPVSFTGPSNNDTVIASVLIPANTFANGDIIRFEAFQSMNFAAGGWIYTSVFLQTDATTPYGPYSLGQIQTPGGQDGNYFKTLYVNGDTTHYRTFSTNVDMQAGSYSGDPTISEGIDWTQNWYLNFNSWVDNAGTFLYVHGMKLTKIN